jgi:transposase
MIESELRRSVAALAAHGMGVRETPRRLEISRNAVRAILAQGGGASRKDRSDKIPLDAELLARLYADCEGFAQRVHEKLREEHGIEIEYSTLTRRLRELGISAPAQERCERRGDEPGAEMQHDTSPYRIPIAGARTRVVASLLYLRFSKRRYLRFYRRFTRFDMKCFFHEALCHWGYAAAVCVIDNTNLARLAGAGKHALIAPEMAAFARQFGFRFQCHAIGHSDRKAGEERSFRTVETNFFPGRSFESMEDLNRQAFEWATVRMEARAQTPARIVPAKAFEAERARLLEVPPGLPAPYRTWSRAIDQYGYVAFGGNYYWVPGERRGEATVLEYAGRIEIYEGRQHRCGYGLPAEGIRNRRFSPEGMPMPKHGPQNRRRPTAEEEARLRALAPAVGAFLDRVLAPRGIQRHEFVRRLFALSRRTTEGPFVRSVERALRYGVRDLATLERIAQLELGVHEEPVQPVEFDESYRDREAYREGELADSPDLSAYDTKDGGGIDEREDGEDAEGAAAPCTP